ncbi:MAG TPA: hypothetical protein O0W88_03965 [Methanocorpusculum sp.]|nr:hypothetical protein [Methanocorpusculum sp.]
MTNDGRSIGNKSNNCSSHHDTMNTECGNICTMEVTRSLNDTAVIGFTDIGAPMSRRNMTVDLIRSLS